MLNTVMWP